MKNIIKTALIIIGAITVIRYCREYKPKGNIVEDATTIADDVITAGIRETVILTDTLTNKINRIVEEKTDTTTVRE